MENDSALNHDLKTLDSSLAATFNAGAYRRVLIREGTQLFRFNGAALYQLREESGKWEATRTPFWGPVKRSSGVTSSLDDHIKRAREAGIPMLEYARNVLAVLSHWNEMGVSQSGLARCLMYTINVDAYVFVGECAAQSEGAGHMANYKQDGRSFSDRVIGTLSPAQSVPSSSSAGARKYPGGATQYVIPNLRTSDIKLATTIMI